MSLQLFGNPLELLPELSPCRQLRSLSIANVRIRADPPFRRWDLEVSPLSYMTRSHKLAPLFALLFRRSSCQHPLLAGALAKLAEERSSCELLAKEDMALPQMVTLAMSSNAVVASAACRALASLAALDEATARKLVSHDLGRTILTLVSSRDASVQLSGCHVLAALCGGNEAVALELASSQLVVQLLQLLLPGSSSHDVQQAALEALGNMAFAKANAARIRGVAGLLQVVSQLAEPPEGAECASAAGVSSTAAGTATVALLPSARGSGGGAGLTASSTVVTAATVGGSAARVSSSGDGSDGRQQHLVSTTSNASSSAAAVISSSAGNAVGMAATATSTTTQVVLTEQQRTRQYAIRLLAVLGENDLVRQSLRQPPIEGRGVRVLALDGGGMKGMTMVAFIRHLERATGKRMAELFDVIAGTSTGGILAVGLGMLGYSADDCDATYNNLGAKVFSRGGADVDADDGSGGGGGSGSSGGKGFQASLSRLYHSTSQATRVAVYGCKHDPSTFEELLHSSCSLLRAGVVTGNRMIDSACLGGPKIVVMSTLTSVSPVQPFAFRNYELPHDAEAAAREACAPRGSSRHLVWQAIRSSSAAPMYLEEFLVGEDRFQDGCLTYNNPTLVSSTDVD